MLEDFVEVKNDLRTQPQGLPRGICKLDIPGNVDDGCRYVDTFADAYGHDIGSELAMAVNEAVINFQDYAHDWSGEKELHIRHWRDDVRVYVAIGSEGSGFDPRILLLDRSFQPGHLPHKRRWGNEIMKMHVDFIIYDPDGKGLLMIKELERPAA